MRALVTMLMVVVFTIVSVPISAQEYPQASEHHKVLANDVGTWEAEMKMWMPGSDEPMVAKGMEVNKMLGDYWLVSKFSGSVAGQEFVGHGTIGYNPVTKKYVGTWLDSMGPFMSHMEGTYDASTKTMTMMMKGYSPDGSESRGKNVAVTKDENTRVFTMYMLQPGTEDKYVKQMEITYRKK